MKLITLDNVYDLWVDKKVISLSVLTKGMKENFYMYCDYIKSLGFVIL